MVLWIQEYLGFSKVTIINALYSICLIILYFLIQNITNRIVYRKVDGIERKYAISKTIHYLSGFIILLALFKTWLGSFTGVAAYFGILSAGLAIALQDPLTNLAGWIFIAFKKPFVVGDRIQIGEYKGDVIDLRVFQFSLIEIGNWVDADQSTGRIIHIPNGYIFKQSQANYTEGFNFIWNEIPVTITFESNWEKAKELLLKITQKHTAIHSEKAAAQIKKAAQKYMIFYRHLTPIVWTSVVDIGIQITIRYLCEPRKRRSSASSIWEDILKEFSQSNEVTFAYPTTRFYNELSEGKKN